MSEASAFRARAPRAAKLQKPAPRKTSCGEDVTAVMQSLRSPRVSVVQNDTVMSSQKDFLLEEVAEVIRTVDNLADCQNGNVAEQNMVSDQNGLNINQNANGKFALICTLQGLKITVARSPKATTFAPGLLKPSYSLAHVAIENYRR